MGPGCYSLQNRELWEGIEGTSGVLRECQRSNVAPLFFPQCFILKLAICIMERVENMSIVESLGACTDCIRMIVTYWFEEILNGLSFPTTK